jgi:hypothetical protein
MFLFAGIRHDDPIAIGLEAHLLGQGDYRLVFYKENQFLVPNAHSQAAPRRSASL